MYVFSIFDQVAEDWSTPFCAKNLGHLKRVLKSSLNQLGIVLDECYIRCIGRLLSDGTVDCSEDVVSIFGVDKHACFYLSELFEDELNKLKEKEVEEDV